MSKPDRKTLLLALGFSLLVPVAGYWSFGPWPALLFLVGYLGGFMLWVSLPTRASFREIRGLYWLNFALFIVHRIEEKVAGFFAELSRLTNVPVPEIVSVPIVLLLVLSIGAWILGPILYSRGNDFGRYLTWTFLASMGITELAHFVLPFFRPGPYGYFPGMLSVIVLAPVAWFTMWRMTRD